MPSGERSGERKNEIQAIRQGHSVTESSTEGERYETSVQDLLELEEK